MSRFLSSWRHAFLASTDASFDYCELAGLVALSTLMVGRRTVAVGKGINLNLYAMLVGDSSVARKSTAVVMARDLVASVDGGRIGPRDYTIEGLVKWMQANKDPETNKSRNKLTLFSDEFGADLARFAAYATTASADLCGLYDGGSYLKVRAGGPSIQIDNPQLGLFGAAAYSMMETSLKTNDWRTGFLMRFIFAAPINMRPAMITQPPNPIGLWDKAKDDACRLLDDVRQSNGGRIVSMPFTAPALSAFEDYTKRLEASVRGHEIATIYVSRFKTNIEKLAALYQIDDDPLLPIGPHAMNHALGLANSVLWPSFIVAVEKTTLDSQEGLVRAFKRRIQSAGREGLRIATLHEEFHRHRFFDGVLRSLRVNDVIRVFKDAQGREIAVWRD